QGFSNERDRIAPPAREDGRSDPGHAAARIAGIAASPRLMRRSSKPRAMAFTARWAAARVVHEGDGTSGFVKWNAPLHQTIRATCCDVVKVSQYRSEEPSSRSRQT